MSYMKEQDILDRRERPEHQRPYTQDERDAINAENARPVQELGTPRMQLAGYRAAKRRLNAVINGGASGNG